MSAYRFYTDEQGFIVRGETVDYGLSSESWSLAHLPVIPLPPEDIAWPNGEQWEHIHFVGNPKETKDVGNSE